MAADGVSETGCGGAAARNTESAGTFFSVGHFPPNFWPQQCVRPLF
jgi:hypothetical protein